MLEDEEMVLEDRTKSEVSYKDAVRGRTITMDESIIRSPTTERDKGGLRSKTYMSRQFKGSRNRGTKGSRHTTGVYSYNTKGEYLPPLYIYDSKAKEENYQIRTLWLLNLPGV
mmetsp:Transcript_20500/g.28829  ORF Transcript_20500/g.28829 Transcript_20500/m.28829 type:complete len:113 (+) Transcript_20500:1193-1531(+)